MAHAQGSRIMTANVNIVINAQDKASGTLRKIAGLFGDIFKDFDGIEYIDSTQYLINLLELIRDNKYEKKYKTQIESNEFSSATELLEYLLRKKGATI